MLYNIRVFIFSYVLSVILLVLSLQGLAQDSSRWHLATMPADLETDYALSALPAHLRKASTVYLLDPTKGYYIAQQGSNGFICFVSRTEWEWNEFRDDLATPISYDAEGARAIFPVYQDVAAMRATGKYHPAQITDTIINRIRRGYYQPPSRPGISYMLSPLMRVYPGMPDNKAIVTISAPHIMYYAPYLSNEELGFLPNHPGPVLNSPGQQLLGKHGAPYGYIIIAADPDQKTEIVKDGQSLMKRLATYKTYFTVQAEGGHHKGTR